jgi:hypothetical protein
MEHGWLCFESVNEKRRLTPIPAAWQLLDDDELASLLTAATVVKTAPQLSSDGVDV